MRHVLGAGALVVVVACGGDDVTTGITPAPTPIANNLFSVSGSVYDTAFRPVDQARVEAIDGPQA